MNKRKSDKIKRIVAMVCAAIVALAFLASIVMPAANAATKAEVEEAKNDTKEAKEQLEQAQKEKDEVVAQYQAIEKQVADAQLEVAEKRDEIYAIETEIAIKEEELAQAEKEYDEYLELFKVRARAMYENTEIDYLEIFFGAENFGDLLSKIEIVSQIMKYDQEILTKLDETTKKIETAKKDLEIIKERLDAEAAVLEEKLQNLEAVSVEKQKMLDEISKDVEKYRAIYDAAEAAEAAAIKEYESALMESANPVQYTGGQFVWPTSGRISSKYGYRIHPVYKTKKFHSGMDIAAPQGTPVYAAASGKVTMATTNGGYGQCVIINHGSGLTTLYGHNSRILVKNGQAVNKGDLIAYVGSTGVSTGPHLHFEVRVNGATKDPMSYLN